MRKEPLSGKEVSELVDGLNRLARNLWWTWNQEAQELFQELSQRGWQNLYHNAVAVLHEFDRGGRDRGCFLRDVRDRPG